MAATKDYQDVLTDLGRAVARRRWELGLTQQEATQRAGVSGTLWSEVERGRRENLSAASAYKIEMALEWPDGTVAAFLEGGDPLMETDTEEENGRLDEMERRLTAIENLLDALLSDVRARLERALTVEPPEGPEHQS